MTKSKTSIVAAIIGIVGLIMCWMPFINNFAAILAGIGFIVGAIGLFITYRNQMSKVWGFLGIGLNICAFALVLATQTMYSNAIDEAFEAPTTEAIVVEDSEGNAVDNMNLAVGETLTLESGLEIMVVDITSETVYDTPVLMANVVLTNTGTDTISFGGDNFKSQNDNGVIAYTEMGGELPSGELAPQGSVSGTVAFESDATTILYYSNMFDDNAVGAWNIQ